MGTNYYPNLRTIYNNKSIGWWRCGSLFHLPRYVWRGSVSVDQCHCMGPGPQHATAEAPNASAPGVNTDSLVAFAWYQVDGFGRRLLSGYCKGETRWHRGRHALQGAPVPKHYRTLGPGSPQASRTQTFTSHNDQVILVLHTVIESYIPMTPHVHTYMHTHMCRAALLGQKLRLLSFRQCTCLVSSAHPFPVES